MSTTTGLADLPLGRTRGPVCALLYGRADQTFYTRQTAREVDARMALRFHGPYPEAVVQGCEEIYFAYCWNEFPAGSVHSEPGGMNHFAALGLSSRSLDLALPKRVTSIQRTIRSTQ